VREKQISLEALFSEDMLGDDLEEWLQESALMKRTFRNCAIIAGLIERNFPGGKDGGMKRSRELRISTDLIYDVLRKAEPDHILLRAARSDAATGLLDIERLGGMLARIKKTPKKILHRPLTRVSPLSVPIMLEIGRESIYGEAQDAILAEAAEGLMREAVAHRNSSLAKRS
jgi:ATP-dependent Lhr-like helicase